RLSQTDGDVDRRRDLAGLSSSRPPRRHGARGAGAGGTPGGAGGDPGGSAGSQPPFPPLFAAPARRFRRRDAGLPTGLPQPISAVLLLRQPAPPRRLPGLRRPARAAGRQSGEPRLPHPRRRSPPLPGDPFHFSLSSGAP